MVIRISKELYSRTVLLKTCYKFTEDYYIHLTSDERDFLIDITSKKRGDNDVKGIIGNELIEQANRELVFKETHSIREILFARAMASSVIYTNDATDEIDTDVNDDSAMKDWFENERNNT